MNTARHSLLKNAVSTDLRATAAVVLAWLLISSGSALAQSPETRDTLHVTGTGIVDLVPDQAAIRMGINARGYDIPSLQRETDQKIAEILDGFRGLDIEDRDLKATDIRISPRYRYDKAAQQSVADGFEVSRELSVTLRDLSLLGNLMTSATEAGVNNISPPQLSSSVYEEKYREALVQAVTQARERATVLTDAANVNLGPVLTMSVQGGHPRPEPMAMRAMAADEASGAYQAGEIGITATVHVTFAILQ